MIPIAAPDLRDDEARAVLAVLRSGRLAQGPIVERFEAAFAEYVDAKFAVATSSGTTALHLALIAHGIGAGDQVITTPFSFVATANVIRAVGAQPVFVDIDPHSFNINTDLIEDAMSEKVRALLPVHLYGNPCDMTRLCAIADRHRIPVIEDACQAHGATHRSRKVGSFGTGCFSFYPTKNMTSGEGGIVTTNDPEIARQLMLLRSHGMKERYQYETWGLNCRMSEIHAAIALPQLKRLDANNKLRRHNAAYLTNALGGLIECPHERPDDFHVFNQYTIRVPGVRSELKKRLAEAGIGSEIYYPAPLHVLPHLRTDTDFPVARQMAAEVLSLPVHPSVSESELEHIARATREAVLDLRRD